jgi:hypothetical protein
MFSRLLLLMIGTYGSGRIILERCWSLGCRFIVPGLGQFSFLGLITRAMLTHLGTQSFVTLLKIWMEKGSLESPIL